MNNPPITIAGNKIEAGTFITISFASVNAHIEQLISNNAKSMISQKYGKNTHIFV